MRTTLTKFFNFSSSYAGRGKIHGHNYRLAVTVGPLDRPSEVLLEKKIRKVLIRKLDARDLGLDVDFLKGIEITEQNLLKVFWKVLKREISPVVLYSLSIQRDERTRVTLSR